MSNLPKILNYAQIVLAVLVITGVALQQRGNGLSSAFGGSSMEYSTKRGLEKWVFYATIVVAILWLVTAVARLVL